MLTAGTADGNSHVTAPLGFETRQPTLQQTTQIFEHLLHRRVAFKEGDHLRVAAGEWPQFRLPVRVRQAAYIKNEVPRRRYARNPPARMSGRP